MPSGLNYYCLCKNLYLARCRSLALKSGDFFIPADQPRLKFTSLLGSCNRHKLDKEASHIWKKIDDIRVRAYLIIL